MHTTFKNCSVTFCFVGREFGKCVSSRPMFFSVCLLEDLFLVARFSDYLCASKCMFCRTFYLVFFCFRAPDKRNIGKRSRSRSRWRTAASSSVCRLVSRRLLGRADMSVSHQKRASREQEPDVLLHCDCIEITNVS